MESIEQHLKGKDKEAWLEIPGPGQGKVSAEVLGDRLPELYAALGREPNRGTVVGVERWLQDARKHHSDHEIVAAVDGIIAAKQVSEREEPPIGEEE